MAAKTWKEKLNDPAPPVVKPAPVDIAGMKKGQVMLVPTARMVDAFIRQIPPGESLNVLGVRRALAELHGAQTTCPITTGYHLRTVAEVACEERNAGAPLEAIAPFWRVLDSRAPTAKKLPCGVPFIAERRQAEGLPA